jgi:hypothetical protein
LKTVPSPRRVQARRLAAAALLLSATAVQAAPTTVLFVGNSFTFGRVDPVMSYNTANVADLTLGMWQTNATNSNLYEPKPWGGVPGIFQRLTVQAGLDYEVAMSARNAATLRGHLLNTNPDGWDLRGNIGSRVWDQIVLQEQSDEALAKRSGLNSVPDYTRIHLDMIENWVHGGGGGLSYRYRDYFPGATTTARNAACSAALSNDFTTVSTGSCGTERILPANANASAATQLYVYQTWARPNFVEGALASTTDPVTGVVTRSANPATTFFPDLETMAGELRANLQSFAAAAGADGSAGFAGIAPVGQAFLRAVQEGVATRNPYAADALDDGRIDLWFDDGLHASKYGSYLSALTLFGTLTGQNPAQFGGAELAAAELGISPQDAWALQRVAALELGFALPPVPEPGTALLSLAGLAAIIGRRLSSAHRHRPGLKPHKV